MKRVLLFLVVLAGIVAAGFGAYQRYVTKIPLKAVQNRPQFDIFLLVDQSGSMKGDAMDPVPSDPEGIRIKAAKYFIDYLQYFSDPSTVNRISIINFGTDTPEDKQIPLTPLNSPDKIKSLKEKIQEYSLGYTNFHQALQKALEFYQKDMVSGESRQPVVIVFTDGEPQDTRKLSKEAYFKELDDFVNGKLKNIKVPGVARLVSYKLFLIGLDARRAYWPHDQANWNRLTENRALLLSQASEEELEAKYGKIIEELFATQAGEWLDLQAGGEQKLIVPPYAEKVLITVKKDIKVQNQKLEIITPKGETLKEGKKLITNPGAGITLHALIEPEAGEWKLKLSPSGKVRIKSDLLPIRLEITRPQAVHPLGEPLDLALTFLRYDGTPIVPLAHYPISLSATVKRPDGSVARPILKEEANRKGYYRIEQPVQVSSAGNCEIVCEATVGSFLQSGNFTLSRTAMPLEVKPVIYFKTTTPTVTNGQSLFDLPFFWKRNPVSVQGKLMRAGKEVPGKELAAVNRNELVLAQVEREKGNGVSAVEFLKYNEGDNTFRGILQPESKLYPGFHNLFTRSELPDGVAGKATREDNNEFRVGYGYGIIGWALLAYVLLYASIQALLRTTRGPLVGHISVGGRNIGTRLSDILIYNKCKVVSKQGKTLPWFNMLRYDGKGKGPTFWVIGSFHKERGKIQPAVIVYHRKFFVIPFWKKLYKLRNNTTINGVTIMWNP